MSAVKVKRYLVIKYIFYYVHCGQKMILQICRCKHWLKVSLLFPLEQKIKANRAWNWAKSHISKASFRLNSISCSTGDTILKKRDSKHMQICTANLVENFFYEMHLEYQVMNTSHRVNSVPNHRHLLRIPILKKMIGE